MIFVTLGVRNYSFYVAYQYPTYNVFMAHQGKIYAISAQASAGEGWAEFPRTLLETILSTFKFIDQTPSI